MHNIAFLHSSAILGGSEKAFLDLVDNLTDHQRKTSIFVLPDSGDLQHALKFRGFESATFIVRWPKLFESMTRKRALISYILFMFSMPFLLFSMLSTLKLLKEKNITMIYSNGLKSHALSLIYKMLGGYSLIWHLQDYFPNLKFVWKLFRFLHIKPDVVLANSKSVADDYQKQTIWPEICQVVHNAVNTKDFAFTNIRAQDELTMSMVGMLTPWKGQDVFIDAVALLMKENPTLDLKCLIVGEEMYKTAGESGFKAQLQDQVSKLKLQNVHFLGLRKDVENIYNQSDIVVHCSKLPEPFGRVIIEAMACKCAVIAADAGGVKEIITPHYDGLLVPPSNPAALKDAMLTLIKDSSKRKTMAENGRKTVQEKFSADAFANHIKKLIEKSA